MKFIIWVFVDLLLRKFLSFGRDFLIVVGFWVFFGIFVFMGRVYSIESREELRREFLKL